MYCFLPLVQMLTSLWRILLEHFLNAPHKSKWLKTCIEMKTKHSFFTNPPVSVCVLSAWFNVSRISATPFEFLDLWATSWSCISLVPLLHFAACECGQIKFSTLGSSSPGKQMTTKYQWALNRQRSRITCQRDAWHKKYVCTRVCVFNSLLINGNKKEILFEDVHVAGPRFHPLVSPLPLTAVCTQKHTSCDNISHLNMYTHERSVRQRRTQFSTY